MVKGLRCTGGSKLFEDLVAAEDAPSVALMREAGAIVLATTNAPEFAMNMESTNNVHGRTRNPYDTNRTPGGSSGLVPNGGSFPLERLFGERSPCPDILNYLCTGPICRYAEDLVTSMRVLSTDKEIEMKLGKKINFEKLKICYLKEIQSYATAPVEPEIACALKETVSYFEQQFNIKAREVKMPWLMDAPRCIINALKNSAPDIIGTLTGGKGVDFNLKTDFLKSFFGKSTLSSSLLAAVIIQDFPLLYRKSRNSHYENLLEKWSAEFDSLLAEDTVLLMPTMPFAAPYHGEGLPLLLNVCYPGIFNILGFPSTSCPIGFNRDRLPIGIQIVGSRNSDPLTLACAVELEKAFGGWRTPGDESL